MPPKQKPDKRTKSPSASNNDCELRNMIRSLLREEMDDIKSTIREEVKQSIKKEIKTALREEFRDRLSNIETQLTLTQLNLPPYMLMCKLLKKPSTLITSV